jgi:thiol-disulfide isomerase/thioredoxin
MASLLLSGAEPVPSLVTIKGTITNPIGNGVSFVFQDTSYDATADENGEFEISFSLDFPNYLNFQHGVESTAMYVNPGDRIALNIDTKQFDETITYKDSPESSFLADKFLINEGRNFYGEPLYLKGKDDYLTYLDDFKTELLEKLNKTGNQDFIEKETLRINETLDRYVKSKDKISELSQDEASYTWQKILISREHNFYAAIDSLNREGFNSYLNGYKEKVMVKLSEVISSKDFIEKEEKSLNKTLNLWNQRKSDIENMPKKGEPAIDFTYPDKDDNEFSLSSFKGSLVFVDVWATWCGPCLAQIPALQQLEEDYYDKNITFLSVSVDTDKDAWLKMLAEKELGGVQLWADGWSEITKSYAIFGIPRFMLFDSKGNTISVDAPRPTSVEIRTMLDANL